MTAAGVRTVHDLCLVDRGISYATVPEGAQEDAANRYDSPATVAEIETHNLRYEAVCGTAGPPG